MILRQLLRPSHSLRVKAQNIYPALEAETLANSMSPRSRALRGYLLPAATMMMNSSQLVPQKAQAW